MERHMFSGFNRFILLLLLFTSAVLESCAIKPQVVVPTAPVAPAATGTAPVAPAASAPPTNITVFYDSDPPGAILYENGNIKRMGETPFWAIYELTEKDRQRGFVFLDPTNVVWPSGATATNYPGIIFDLKGKLEKTYFFIRPDVKGKEDDYDYGLKRTLHRYTYGEDDNNPNTDK